MARRGPPRRRRDVEAKTKREHETDDVAEEPGADDAGDDNDAGHEVVDEEQLDERPVPSWRFGVIALAAAVLGLGVGVGVIALLRDDGGQETTEVSERLVVQGPVVTPLVAGEPVLRWGCPRRWKWRTRT